MTNCRFHCVTRNNCHFVSFIAFVVQGSCRVLWTATYMAMVFLPDQRQKRTKQQKGISVHYSGTNMPIP